MLDTGDTRPEFIPDGSAGMGVVGTDTVAPDPSRLIDALRQIGYSLEQALSDLIDNAISADAGHVLIRFLRSGDEPSGMPVVTENTAVGESPSQAVASFAEQIEAARLHESQRQAPTSSRLSRQQAASQTPVDRPADETDAQVATERPARSTATLPTIYELQANGILTLPELHLDIHVYSDTPEDRFVFINMSKRREKSQLAEGPTIEEITPDGVVLDHRGTTFLLPRD